ncbi:nitric oxide reductase F protein [Ruegeria marisrubri]|uniref:Nitric oxide reductase F protein n=1 Tax=Ruegeria marisrubri TaxID=1685379 RepID=A0A0X3TCF0_9RHOB|nr:cytochrome C oxidase subunit IV family protein [Ruegeria marisrubri]KUJ73448.1 nitric oxide reductase F protein [Ruegeria marisrubri]
MPLTSSFSKYSRRRPPDFLTFAWLALLALSFASALLTRLALPPQIVGGGILLLALAKARVILARYLDLADSPAWLRGFTIVLAGFSILVFALYLV